MFITDIVKKKKNTTEKEEEISFSSYGEAHRLKQDLEKLKELERNEYKVSFKNDNDDDDGGDDEEREEEALHHTTRSERRRRSSLALRNGSVFYSNGTSGCSSHSQKERKQSSVSIQPLVEKEKGEKNELSALTTLDADTVRWMNRRKTVTGPLAALYNYQTTLASALPYKPIFKGLDTADEGEIALTDIEDVIKKLSHPMNGEERLFDDPKAILKFFREMDTDGGGTVSFGEFSIGAYEARRCDVSVSPNNSSQHPSQHLSLHP
jgi:hypothetical protein